MNANIARKTLMELCILGEYGVANKVGVCECIEELDDKTINELAKEIIHSKSDQEIKLLLEDVYHNKLKEKNKELPILNESAWMNNRDNILMEADNERPSTSGEIVEIFKKGGPYAVAIYLSAIYSKNPGEAARRLQHLKNLVGHEAYLSVTNQLRRISNGKINFPDLKNTDKALHDLNAHYQAHSSRYKSGKTPGPNMQKGLDAAKDRVRKARMKDLVGNKEAIIKTAKYTGSVLLILMGITGLSIAVYKLMQDLSIKALKECGKKSGKERSVCILTHKIAACDIGLRKWKEALGSCQDKPNPEKCIHSVQTQIWNIQKRKTKYQQKLMLLSKHVNTTPPHPSTIPPEDIPSGDGGGVFKAKA